MAQVKCRDCKSTELAFIKLLKAGRISGWRRNQNLFGKPDFVFVKERVVIFVDGCFWSVGPLHGSVPATNRDFWLRKIDSNRRRDQKVARSLRRRGWHVVRVWEHSLREPHMVIQRVSRYGYCLVLDLSRC